jgi:hypothetical protein
MRLDDCDLDDIDVLSLAPFERNAPEGDWVAAAKDGTIPASLYNLYQRANFLSFGTSPRFLSDEKNILFSYFGLVLRSIHESLLDAHEQATSFATEQALVRDPMKVHRGEKWEEGADKRARRHFRDLLIALQTAFDSLADVIAIFFPGRIKGLKVGRSQFSKIELWIKEPFPAASMIVSPSEFYLRKLHDAVKPLILAPHPETNWLPMMRLLRNKSAHFEQPLFRQWGLPRAGDGRLFVFIPREWPCLWESLFEPAGYPKADPSFLPQLLRDSLIRQDIVTYSCGLLDKAKSVIAAALIVLNETYDQFKDLTQNQSALAELKNNFEKYDFENFV